jgi:cytochrome c553
MPQTNITCRMSLRVTLLSAALLPAAALAADLASQAATLTADAPHGMVLFLKHCAGCHGRRAWGDGPREIPALAGQRESYLIGALAGFISGGRRGSELHGRAMHESLQPPDLNRAQALRDLAGWLSGAPLNPEPEHGAGQALAAGRQAYAGACAGCHGANGEGREQPAVPALAAQHYSYLLAQLRSFSAGQLAHAPGLDRALLGPPEQQQALADYASRLAPATGHGEP